MITLMLETFLMKFQALNLIKKDSDAGVFC